MVSFSDIFFTPSKNTVKANFHVLEKFVEKCTLKSKTSKDIDMNKLSLFNFFNARTDWFSAFTNGKNLRVAVILIAIYHMVC